MLRERLGTYMQIIAQEVIGTPSIKECTVRKSARTNKNFIQILTRRNQYVGLSYVFATETYELWSNFGDFKDFKDQLHISFSSMLDLFCWLKYNDLDEVLDAFLTEKDPKQTEQEILSDLEDEYAEYLLPDSEIQSQHSDWLFEELRV